MARHPTIIVLPTIALLATVPQGIAHAAKVVGAISPA